MPCAPSPGRAIESSAVGLCNQMRSPYAWVDGCSGSDAAAVADHLDLWSAVHPGQPNDHLNYAINRFCPGQIEVIMLALQARKALKP